VNTLRNLLLSVALICVPVAGVLGYQTFMNPAAAVEPVAVFGDMQPFQSITSAVQDIAATGDLAAAKNRIKDLETAWDEAVPTLRPVNADAWGNVDSAIDGALHALRAATPTQPAVLTSLKDLQATLADPFAGASGGASGPTLVAGIAVTDAQGHALPCEVMLTSLTEGLASAPLTDADQTTVADLQTKATERCNADDDARADAFTAQALAILAATN
jgi:hypothetical protein